MCRNEEQAMIGRILVLALILTGDLAMAKPGAVPPQRPNVVEVDPDEAFLDQLLDDVDNDKITPKEAWDQARKRFGPVDFNKPSPPMGPQIPDHSKFPRRF
jgi:hypothetical protein